MAVSPAPAVTVAVSPPIQSSELPVVVSGCSLSDDKEVERLTRGLLPGSGIAVCLLSNPGRADIAAAPVTVAAAVDDGNDRRSITRYHS